MNLRKCHWFEIVPSRRPNKIFHETEVKMLVTNFLKFVFTFSRSNVSGKQGIDSNFDDRSSKIPNSFSGVWMRQISCVLAPSLSSYSGYMTNFLDVSWNSSTPMFLLDLSFHIKLKKIGSSYELKLSGRVKHILTVADHLFWTGSFCGKRKSLDFLDSRFKAS